ncbi:MAG: hypothetical protein ACRESZ_21210 [Methylococcales bacterium]
MVDLLLPVIQKAMQYRRMLFVWFANLLHRFSELADRVIFVIGLVLLIGGIFLVLALWNWNKIGAHVTIFVVMEFFAVLLALGYSTYSYSLTIGRIRTRDIPGISTESQYILIKERAYEQIFRFVNVTLFVVALSTILNPIWHIFFVQAIYFCFVLNNYLQLQLSLGLWDEAGLGIERALDLNHWLTSENGAAVFGYLFILVVISFLYFVKNNDPIFGSWLSFSLGEGRPLSLLKHDWEPMFQDMIKALGAGVAGYHLALSTAGFFFSHRSGATNLITYKKVADLIRNDKDKFRAHIEANVVSKGLFWWVVVAFVISLVGVLVNQGCLRW